MWKIAVELLLSEAQDPCSGREKSQKVQRAKSDNIVIIIGVLINCSNLNSSYSIEDGDYDIHMRGYDTIQIANEILQIIMIVVLYAIGNDDQE